MEIRKIKDINEYLSILNKKDTSELTEEDVIKWVVNAQKAGKCNYETLTTILDKRNASYVSENTKKRCFDLMRKALKTGRSVMCGCFLGNDDDEEQPDERYFLDIL